MRLVVALLIFISAHLTISLPQRASAQTGTEGNSMADSVMPADRFWELINRTTKYQADQDAQVQALNGELHTLSAAEIEAFERAFQQQKRRTHTWDLWGAAYVMNGGASDDGFEYFQRWLISRGRRVYEAALADPESLADLPGEPGEYEFEGFATVAADVWAEKTGINPWSDPKARFPHGSMPLVAEPEGEPFEEDGDHLAQRYPKLWARFGEQ